MGMWEVCIYKGGTINPWPHGGDGFKLEALSRGWHTLSIAFLQTVSWRRMAVLLSTLTLLAPWRRLNSTRLGRLWFASWRRWVVHTLQCDAILLLEKKGRGWRQRPLAPGIWVCLLPCWSVGDQKPNWGAKIMAHKTISKQLTVEHVYRLIIWKGKKKYRARFKVNVLLESGFLSFITFRCNAE